MRGLRSRRSKAHWSFLRGIILPLLLLSYDSVQVCCAEDLPVTLDGQFWQTALVEALPGCKVFGSEASTQQQRESVLKNINAKFRSKEAVDFLVRRARTKGTDPQQLSCALTILGLVEPNNPLEEEYQSWADLCRMKAIYEIVDLIKEFKAKKGSYPYQGETNVPVEARLTRGKLEGEDRYFPKGRSGEIVGWPNFIDHLKGGLAREVRLPVDPQRIASAVPGYIQYYTDHKNFWLAVNLYHERPGTRRVGEHHYKFEVSSISNPERVVRDYSSISKEEADAAIENAQIHWRPCPYAPDGLCEHPGDCQ